MTNIQRIKHDKNTQLISVTVYPASCRFYFIHLTIFKYTKYSLNNDGNEYRTTYFFYNFVCENLQRKNIVC